MLGKTAKGGGPCALLLLLAMSASWPQAALAYCRTHTDDAQDSVCPPTCTKRGNPLYWLDNKISYAFNERGFPGLPDAQLRAIFDAAFETWLDVRCDGEEIGFQITQQKATTQLDENTEKEEPNTNVVAHFDAVTWIENDHSPHSYALTYVWYADNGRIYGADMLFNGGQGPFGDCESAACGTVGAPRVDLQNVATHELGHFFGLAHSDVEGSTMQCSADAGVTFMRTLEPDDMAGLCEIYPPGLAFPVAKDEGRCALRDGRHGAGLALLLLLWRRRRLKK